MASSYFSALKDNLQSKVEEDNTQSTKSNAGIFVANGIYQRVIEGASSQLDLTPVLLSEDSLENAALATFELIVADEPIVQQIRNLLSTYEQKGESITPAVVAVRPRNAGSTIIPGEPDPTVDGILSLPMAPAQVAAQLGIILYAHRAFARRYQSDLDELHLNRRIFRSVTSGISVASATLPDMPLVYVNPAFEIMTGYPLEEVLGRNCRFLQNEDRDQPALTLVREALAGQRETLTILKNYRKDGTPFWNEFSLSPIRNREGALTHFVGIQTDVTTRIEFETALRDSEKLAAVGRLASSIAHEINNPLESVMNLLYLAQHTSETSEINEYLSMADKELQRVKLITSQSLRFYKQSTKPQAIGCTELINTVLDLYQARLLNTGVKVERRERSTQSIVCMESEIRQVLSNLVGNAIDAMKRAGGRLLIRTREATEWRYNTPGIVITIADTGSGITPETMKNIYKAFYTTKGIAGTGLGLWISSEIVERHHGRLKARSCTQPEKSGTIFELFLPYQGLTS